MPIRNDERLLVEAVIAFAADHGYGMERLSHDWILVLDRDGNRHTIFGYDVGLNSATALRVCNDKAASFDVLVSADVPMIEHRLFLEPIMHRFTGQPGNWADLLNTFEAFGGDVVVKANEGTSGNDVHRVQDRAELERVTHLLLQSCRSIAVSPFTRLNAEKRFVVLDGAIELAYAKNRPGAVGDGTSTVRQLAATSMSAGHAEAFGEWLAGTSTAELDRVAGKDETLAFGWRHNLGHGSTADIIDPETAEHNTAAKLALRAARAVNLRFGSVDIAETSDGATTVMEVNAGVMLEHFGQGSTERKTQALSIYRRALDRIFTD